MSDMGDMWKEIKEERRGFKEGRVEHFISTYRPLLEGCGYNVREFNMYHYRLTHPEGKGIALDYWPSSGKYWIKGKAKKGVVTHQKNLLDKFNKLFRLG